MKINNQEYENTSSTLGMLASPELYIKKLTTSDQILILDDFGDAAIDNEEVLVNKNGQPVPDGNGGYKHKLISLDDIIKNRNVNADWINASDAIVTGDLTVGNKIQVPQIITSGIKSPFVEDESLVFTANGSIKSVSSIMNTQVKLGMSTTNDAVLCSKPLYNKKDGQAYPVSHPDISTQDSILPERFGKYKIHEILMPVVIGNDAIVRNVSSIPPKSIIMDARFFNTEVSCCIDVLTNDGQYDFVLNREIINQDGYILCKYYNVTDTGYYYDKESVYYTKIYTSVYTDGVNVVCDYFGNILNFGTSAADFRICFIENGNFNIARPGTSGISDSEFEGLNVKMSESIINISNDYKEILINDSIYTESDFTVVKTTPLTLKWSQSKGYTVCDSSGKVIKVVTEGSQDTYYIGYTDTKFELKSTVGLVQYSPETSWNGKYLYVAPQYIIYKGKKVAYEDAIQIA